jgi:ubiquinone/menaquinone biosynthesis C-methylase UbiE
MTRKFFVIAAALLGIGAGVAWAVRARSQPSACPYGQRVLLDLPRPFMRREMLRELLGPVPGERVLEVGPGTGYYSLDVARALAPGGQLDALDVQQPMLDELMRRAAAAGIGNIASRQGDAAALPYSDATFDAAFLVATLGEIPDRDLALRELRRVLKPGGRLVVGEGQPDPHMVHIDDLRRRAREAGFRFERRGGGRLGYLVRFQSA